MIVRNPIGRILHITYPAIVFTIATLIWSSSDLAKVARFAPPPVNDGFNFRWNPTVSDAVAPARGGSSSPKRFSSTHDQRV